MCSGTVFASEKTIYSLTPQQLHTERSELKLIRFACLSTTWGVNTITRKFCFKHPLFLLEDGQRLGPHQWQVLGLLSNYLMGLIEK